MDERISLEQLLFSQGFGTRRACRAIIASGSLAIGGQVMDDPAGKIHPDGLEFTVDGVPWRYRRKVYVMMNKPAGSECSHSPGNHPSVFSLLPEPFRTRGVECAGRLDADTTGLLIFSDDGPFIHRIMSPKKKVPKTYRVTNVEAVSDSLLGNLLSGVLLKGEKEPSVAVRAEKTSDISFDMAITEGKYHQVKRMVAAAGGRVAALHRSAIGQLLLDSVLAPGEWRDLTESERLLLESGDK